MVVEEVIEPGVVVPEGDQADATDVGNVNGCDHGGPPSSSGVYYRARERLKAWRLLRRTLGQRRVAIKPLRSQPPNCLAPPPAPYEIDVRRRAGAHRTTRPNDGDSAEPSDTERHVRCPGATVRR